MLRVIDSGRDGPTAPGDEWLGGTARDTHLGAVSAVLDRQVAVAGADEVGRITFVSRAFCALSGYSQGELLGRDHRLLDAGSASQHTLAELRQTLAAGDSWAGELAHRGKDGNPRWVAATVVPLGPGSHAGSSYICVCSDITQAKRRAARELEQLREQQRQNDEQYARAASHDLQEPLRAIVSCGQMLEQDFAASVDPTARQLVAHMVEGGKRLQRLVLDLLTYARTGTHHPRLVCVSCHDALARALARLEPTLQERGAELDARGLPPILADPQQLVDLFHHLVSNALEYCGAERPVIRVRAAPDGEFWRFSLSDNGIGIAPEAQRRIFYLFQRLHARHEPAKRGLGLPLCKKIVERHGGRIWVESEGGRGATFFFTWPARLALPPEPFE